MTTYEGYGSGTVCSALARELDYDKQPTCYLGDLIHDGAWIQRHMPKPGNMLSFYWGVRDSGTSIGTDPSHVKPYNTRTYKVLVQRHPEPVMLGAEPVRYDRIEIVTVTVTQEPNQ